MPKVPSGHDAASGRSRPPFNATSLPPKPTLDGCAVSDPTLSGAILNWNVSEVPETNIEFFELCFIDTTDSRGDYIVWKRLIRLRNLALPGSFYINVLPKPRYDIAIRAIDANNRIGPFSDILSLMY